MNTNQSITEPEKFEGLIDLKHYWKILKKKWWVIFIFICLISTITYLFTKRITPIYQATAVLLIESSERKAISIEDVVGIDSSRQEYYLTQFELIKSRTIAEQVIKKLKLKKLKEFYNEPKDLDKNWYNLFFNFFNNNKVEKFDDTVVTQIVLDKYNKNLLVTPINSTQLVKITFRSEDPQLAAQVANEIGEQYIKNNLQARLFENSIANDWLNERVGELKKSVSDAERALTAFLETEQLVDLSGIDSLASEELTDLSKRLASANERRLAAESLFELLQNNRNINLAELASVPEISKHPQLTNIRKSEIEAERNVSELSKRYGPKHDKMIQAKARLAAVKEHAARLLSDLAKGIEKELASARNQEQALRNELSTKKQEFQEIVVKRANYDILKREVDRSRELYDIFVTRQKENRAAGDYKSAVARFSDYAIPPIASSFPKIKLIVFISIILSFIFIVCLIFMEHSFRGTIESPSVAEERTKKRILGLIPRIKTKNGELVTSKIEQENNFFDESIKNLRTGIILNSLNTTRKVLSITSCFSGEGKSTISANLAMSLSELEKTIIIDCDLRKPSLNKIFGFSRTTAGVVDYVTNPKNINDFIIEIEQSSLHVLPAGIATKKPLEIISSTEFKKLIQELATKYDRIIIDTPPLGLFSDPLVIAEVSDTSLIVVEAHTTKFEHVERLLTKYRSFDLEVDGLILNKFKIEKKDYQDYYNYYS